MLPETLHLPDQIRQAILVHAHNCAPNECCGLLASDARGLRFAYPLTNIDPSPVSYTVDPDEHFAALNHAESMGWQLSGAFHSHPASAATPSVVDVLSALEPDWVYVIASPNEVRAFRIVEKNISELDVV